MCGVWCVVCCGGSQIRFPEMERAFKKFLNMDDEKEGNVTFDQFIELFGAEPTGETKKVGARWHMVAAAGGADTDDDTDVCIPCF
jgi:hypothetical protein